MGRYNKKKRMESELAEQEAKRRSGLIRLIGSIAAFIIVARQFFAMEGAEWIESPFVSFGIFAFAVVMAGVAGYGARDYVRARDRINAIYRRL